MLSVIFKFWFDLISCMKKLSKNDFKILQKETKFSGSSFDVIGAKIKLADNSIANWTYIEGTDVVFGIPITSKGKVILVKEFRVSANDLVLQIPGGKTKAKTESQRKKEISRELGEEIGFMPKKLEKLAEGMGSVHYSTNYFVYLATNLVKVDSHPDEGELIETIELPIDKAIKLVLSGKHPTTFTTIAALLLAKEKLKKYKEIWRI